MFEGTTVAIITPFNEKGRVDFGTLRSLARLHKDSGTDAILLSGCTGESFTLDNTERLEMLKTVRAENGGSYPILLGTGAPSTKAAVEMTLAAKNAGADGVLAITPYGNKPSQHAMISYFREIADVGLPTILYNVPGRTGSNIAPSTTIALSEHKNIVAIKEASGSLDTVSEIISGCGITVLSGDDSLTVPMISIGAKGVISTAANLVPSDFADMVNFALQGDFASAAKLHIRMFPLMKALFIEGNPVPLKTAMALCGMIPGANFRSPLSAMAAGNLAKLEIALKEYGLF